MEDSVAERLDAHYGGADWRQRLEQHIGTVRVPGLGIEESYGPIDVFGTVWRFDKRPYHLERPVLQAPDLKLRKRGSSSSPPWDSAYLSAPGRCAVLRTR
jgi:hypothetical protein